MHMHYAGQVASIYLALSFVSFTSNFASTVSYAGYPR